MQHDAFVTVTICRVQVHVFSTSIGRYKNSTFWEKLSGLNGSWLTSTFLMDVELDSLYSTSTIRVLCGVDDAALCHATRSVNIPDTQSHCFPIVWHWSPYKFGTTTRIYPPTFSSWLGVDVDNVGAIRCFLSIPFPRGLCHRMSSASSFSLLSS
jgi:hypothetical protein